MYYRGNSTEVDLNDLAPADKIFDALGRGGSLRMNLADMQSAIRYLAGPRKLVFLAKIRNAISQKNKTKRPNTDTRLGHNVLIRGRLVRKLRSMSWKGAALLKTSLNIWRWFQMDPRSIRFKN